MAPTETKPRATRARRLLLLAAAPVLLAFAVLFGALVYRAHFLGQPVGAGQAELAAFRIESGTSFRRVAEELERSGWVSNALLVRLEARVQGWDRKVHPGVYPFRPGEKVSGLLGRLARGEFEYAQVTIPEGWRLGRILERVSEASWAPLAELNALAADDAWLEREGVPGPGLEGYVFPETYRIPLGESPERVLRQIVQPGLSFYRDSLRTRADALGLDAREVWSLAAVIESEAVHESERRRISAVFWNRLRRGMRLESDPTVLFALGRAPGRVLYRDLEVASPYNTYRNTGLPPGPICSPGRASLRAAVDPLPGCEDLFFVARGDGSHVFSRTLAEHNRARVEVRKRK